MIYINTTIQYYVTLPYSHNGNFAGKKRLIFRAIKLQKSLVIFPLENGCQKAQDDGMSVKDFGQDERDEKKALHDVKAAAKAHNQLALDTLAEICGDRTASASARGFAAVALLDRGNGKPKDDDAGGRALGRMSLDDLLALRDAILLRAAAPAPTTAPEPDLGRKLPPIGGLVIEGVACPAREGLQDD